MDSNAVKSPFRLELEAIVKSRYLVNHPMYVRWAKGELSKETMAGCMAESYHYVSNLYPIFFLIAAKAPPDVIEMELENYADEMNPKNPHPALFLRFIKACGGDPEKVRNGRGLPSTEYWVEWLTRLAKEHPWQAAVAAVHVGSEFQGVGTFKSILPALREQYKFSEHDIEHFWLHAEVDVQHSGTAFDVLERHCHNDADRQMVKHYVAESVRRRWFFMDCVYLHYDKGELN
jgi:pyrroloquinoline quinone (PQQ) biosynthesis protein C